jgi:hypothetical protein
MDTSFGPVVVTDTHITVSGLATTFNTLKGLGEAESKGAVTFTAKRLATDELLETNGRKYTWVTMDYMLMMGDQDLVEVDAKLGVENMLDYVSHSLTNVPLKKNFRTNIVGNLFTTDAKLNIIVEPGFNQPDEIVTVK